MGTPGGPDELGSGFGFNRSRIISQVVERFLLRLYLSVSETALHAVN
jgi:hypothetical protein